MHATHIIGLLLLLQIAGCAVTRNEPSAGTLQRGTVVVERLAPAVPEPAAATGPLNFGAPAGRLIIERLPPLPDTVPEVPVAAAPPVVPIVPAAPVAAPPAAPVPPAVTTAAKPAPATAAADPVKAAAKPPAKVALPATPAAQPQKPAAANTRAAASTLDLDALEQRLKNTDAIGVFTKIALKNQVDDLLKRFKAYHESDGKMALAQLRQSYDQLLQKANDVLKSGDPSLAGEIMSSREAIWGVLADPVKFAKL